MWCGLQPDYVVSQYGEFITYLPPVFLVILMSPAPPSSLSHKTYSTASYFISPPDSFRHYPCQHTSYYLPQNKFFQWIGETQFFRIKASDLSHLSMRWVCSQNNYGFHSWYELHDVPRCDDDSFLCRTGFHLHVFFCLLWAAMHSALIFVAFLWALLHSTLAWLGLRLRLGLGLGFWPEGLSVQSKIDPLLHYWFDVHWLSCTYTCVLNVHKYGCTYYTNVH